MQYPKNLPPNTRIDGMNRDHLPIEPQKGLDIDELSDQVSTVDGSQNVVLRRYQRTGARKPRPLLIYIHGGGGPTPCHDFIFSSIDPRQVS